MNPRCGLGGLLAAVLTLGSLVAPVSADTVESSGFYDETEALRFSQSAIGRQLGDYEFRDPSLRPVRLGDYRGKPLVVSMIYTSCADTCPLIIQTLYDAVEAAQAALGEDGFSVVTIGFDVRSDTPARMRAFARTQGVDLANWAFLSTDGETMEKLVADLGFIYFPSPKGFDHLAQTTVVDEEGVIYRQIYGSDFDPPVLGEHLKDLVFGRNSDYTSVSGLINRIRLFCTIYDPSDQRYRFDYSIFIGTAIGLIVLLSLGFVIIRALVNVRRLGGSA